MIEKKIDRLGRVVLPKSYRDKLCLKANDKVAISLDKSNIIIASDKAFCALCGKTINYDTTVPLCKPCILKVKDLC